MEQLDVNNFVIPMKNALSAALQEFTVQIDKFEIIEGENLFQTTERVQKFIKILDRHFSQTQKTDDEKKAFLLNHLSEKALEDYEAIPEVTIEQNFYLNCVETLKKALCVKNPYTKAERVFLSIRPLPKESPHNTLKRISKSAQHCNFDHPDQESMRLALAVISNPSWMSQSIEKKWTKENFEEGMAFAKLLETLKAEKELTTESNTINTINSASKTKQNSSREICRRCLRNNHEKGKRNCPSFGLICYRCGLFNHFSRSCNVRPTKSMQKENFKVATTVKSQTNQEQPIEKKPCRKCLRHHVPGTCFAKDQFCDHCGIKGHYKRACHNHDPQWHAWRNSGFYVPSGSLSNGQKFSQYPKPRLTKRYGYQHQDFWDYSSEWYNRPNMHGNFFPNHDFYPSSPRKSYLPRHPIDPQLGDESSFTSTMLQNLE